MSEILLTVAGDRASLEVEIDQRAPLGPRLQEWAAACSSRPASELIMVSGNGRHVFDPAGTPASLGLHYGAVVRLATMQEANQLRDANTAPGLEAPPPAPEPGWADQIASPEPQPVVSEPAWDRPQAHAGWDQPQAPPEQPAWAPPAPPWNAPQPWAAEWHTPAPAGPEAYAPPAE